MTARSRRGIAVAGGVAALCALLAVALPAGLGVLVERHLQVAAERSPVPGVTVRDLEVERGLWRSTWRSIIEVEGRYGRRYYEHTGEPLLLAVESRAVHGPLLRDADGGVRLGAARVASAVELPAGLGEARPGGGAQVLPVASWVALTGERHEHRTHLAAGGHRGATWSPVNARAWVGGNGWRARVSTERWTYQPEEGRDAGPAMGLDHVVVTLKEGGEDGGNALTGTLDARSAAVRDAAAGRVEADDVRARWSWNGARPLPRFEGVIGGSGYRSWLPEAGEDTAPESVLDDWEVGASSRAEDGVATVRLHGDVVARAPHATRASVTASVERLDATALADILGAARRARESADPFHLGVAVGERLLVQLPDLLERKPELRLEARLAGDDGDARLKGHVRYAGTATVPLREWPRLVRGLEGEARLQAHRPYLRRFLTAVLRQELGATGRSEADAQLRQVAERQIDLMLEFGWLRPDGDETATLSSTVELRDGRLLLHGEEAARLPGAEGAP